MAQAKKTLQDTDGLSVWLKHKFVKRRNGEEKEVFQGSVDIGGGKMLKIQVDARLYTVPLDIKGTEVPALPVYVSKWKADNSQQNQQRKKAW